MYEKYPALTDNEAANITNNFCGTPPNIDRVKYHVWLNEEKMKYYTKSPFYKGDVHRQHIDGFKKLIDCGKKILEKLNENKK